MAWAQFAAAALSALSSGGGTDISAADATGQVNMDSSGWVVGDGDAVGGSLSMGQQESIYGPWYLWAAGALVGVAVMKKVAQ